MKRFIEATTQDFCLPPCGHYSRCGGCQAQHIPYEAQLRNKERYLAKLFANPVSVHPAPSPYRYRSRMDFIATFGKLGLHKKRTFRRIVDIEHCHLISESMNEAFLFVKNILREHEIPDFDINLGTGFLKYVVFRQTFSGEIMVILMTAEAGERTEEKLRQAMNLIAGDKKITSCWWLLSRHYTDRTHTIPCHHTGTEFIMEELSGFRFAIGPQTFFQNNTAVAERCFKTIREHITGDTVLDAYCGCGVIGIFSSRAARAITGIDKNPESVEMAKNNAELNKIGNISFRTGQIEDAARADGASYDTVIVDPPRAGLGWHTVNEIEKKLKPGRIIYMSCNPESQLKDIRRFEGYGPSVIEGFDMFPQTNHIETIAVLDRK